MNRELNLANPIVLDAFNRKSDIGPHGIAHWLRVAETGLWLAEQTGADMDVVFLFAMYHDVWREHDGYDLKHGRVAAQAMADMDFGLDEMSHQTLLEAVRNHPIGVTHDDPTIGTCWDADRLDLPRVGITPDPRLLSTKAARDSLLTASHGEPYNLRWAR